MIIPRLRSEARGGSSYSSSARYSATAYGEKIHHGQHLNDTDLKRTLQNSYSLQTVRKWEKRWIVIHETSIRVHKWMPVPITTSTSSNTVKNKIANLSNNHAENQQEERDKQKNQLDSTPNETQDTQMVVDEESTSQSSKV